MIHRTPHEIAAEIRMGRSQSPRTLLIVEGRDDRLLMEAFVSQSTCRIEVAGGKQNVCDVIDILDAEGFNGVLGLVDADFDRIEGSPARSHNLVMPECHDLIMMLVKSPALGRTITELGSRPKLETFNENVVDALLNRALPIGYLRLYSLRENLNLRFRGLNFSAWINRTTFTADTGKLIRTVKNHSQRQDLSDAKFAVAIKEMHGFMYDPYELCNGTDVIEILSIGLRGVLGNKQAREVESELLKRFLRLAYSKQDFRSSSLKKEIEKWESQRPGHRVLKDDMN
ncbi:MAG: DUF4435 domain-containing protein [Caldilineaceae bacterium SB0661_bin_32]|uniref:DUF4435 domain-containing protein n=1 Tax=Caldilineaceae bacterium SB0661_bin_32 TaxID=2605255 RepID=A0A6B1D2I4_9CHLR|nr:DUF4435 domain-containing protein [Caldilineaceae bacterium SB0661_bin_32]